MAPNSPIIEHNLGARWEAPKSSKLKLVTAIKKSFETLCPEGIVIGNPKPGVTFRIRRGEWRLGEERWQNDPRRTGA